MVFLLLSQATHIIASILFAEDKDKVTIGKTVLLPDKKTGGVKVRLYINTTVGKCNYIM